MEWEFGESYAGMVAADYMAIWNLNNSTLNDWLQSHMTPVNNGEFYIFNPDVDGMMELEPLLVELDIDMPEIPYFVYLKSTWNMVGF